MKARLDNVEASEAGDYYQLHFEAADPVVDDEGERAYFLIQCDFEDDDTYYYIESNDQNYIGHFEVAHAVLYRNRFCLNLKRRDNAKVEVTFRASNRDFIEIARITRVMFLPNLEVKNEKGRERCMS